MTDRKVLTPEEIWRRYDDVESRLTAPLSERMLDLAGIGPGLRVLDLATGRGEPALRAARRVAPDGLVVGIERSDGILEMAREKARLSGLSNLDLRVADAVSALDIPSDHFHAATVRWGLMYMTAPVAALANVERALWPTGVLVAALWAEPERVPYYTLPRRLLQRYRVVPPVDAGAPGAFYYADLERMTRDFGRAGLVVDHVEEMEVTVFESEADGEMVDWVRALGLTQLLNELPEHEQRAWETDLTSEVRRHGRGSLRLGGVTRIVRAHKASRPGSAGPNGADRPWFRSRIKTERANMYQGSCLCRSVRYEIRGEIGDFGYCHCTSCRKASGTAHAANAPVQRADFHVTSGEDSLREFESSPGKLRVFCGRCGSPVYAYLRATTETIRIRLGTLDTPFMKGPKVHTWVSDKAPWDPIGDDLPQFPEWAPRSVLEQKGSRQP